MRSLILVFLFIAGTVFAQTGKVVKLDMQGTAIASGVINLTETLITRQGATLNSGSYKIGLTIGSDGLAYFILSTIDSDRSQSSGEPTGAFNTKRQTIEKIHLNAEVVKNSLVKGIARIKGDFKVQPFSPTEAIISFSSKQLDAKTTVGRTLNTLIADVYPSSIFLEEQTECGPGCMMAYAVVTVKNGGNSPAIGKWNVVLVEPNVFLGSFENLQPNSDSAVRSVDKIKFQCCGPLKLQVKVYADFFNKAAVDGDQSNNIKEFAVKLQ